MTDVKGHDTEEKESYEFSWGDEWLPEIAAALNIDLIDVQSITLHFETGKTLRVDIHRRDYLGIESTEEGLEFPGVWGILSIKDALGLPHVAQALDITITRGEWVTFNYTFSPYGDPLDEVVGDLTLIKGERKLNHERY